MQSNDKPAVKSRKQLEGVVSSDRMDKTIVVKVLRFTKHAKYKKIIRRHAKFKAHDEKNEARTGDKVRIIEARPISKDKRWRLLKVVEAKA